MFPSEIHVDSCVCEPEKCSVGVSTSGLALFFVEKSGLVLDIIISAFFRPLVPGFAPNSSQKKSTNARHIYKQTTLIYITTHGDIRLQIVCEPHIGFLSQSQHKTKWLLE
jgi:hypothetical protein